MSLQFVSVAGSSCHCQGRGGTNPELLRRPRTSSKEQQGMMQAAVFHFKACGLSLPPGTP